MLMLRANKVHLCSWFQFSVMLFFVSNAVSGPLAAQTGENTGSPVDFRAPLLPEGSHIFEADGRLQYNVDDHCWRFVIASDQRDTPNHELTLLPNRELERIEDALSESGETDVAYQLTAQIFVYRGRNYALPTHARIVTPEAQTQSITPATSKAEHEPTTQLQDDSAQDIIRKLEEATGPLIRSAVPRSTQSPQDDYNMVYDEAELIVSRRGSFVNGESGQWLLVFEADATGLADPPLELLPCQLLEEVEFHVRRRGPFASALITGSITTYQGRNFLLPTFLQLPRERENLQP